MERHTSTLWSFILSCDFHRCLFFLPYAGIHINDDTDIYFFVLIGISLGSMMTMGEEKENEKKVNEHRTEQRSRNSTKSNERNRHWDRSNFLVKQTLIFRQSRTYHFTLNYYTYIHTYIYRSFCFSLETLSFTCWEIKSGHSRSHEFASDCAWLPKREVVGAFAWTFNIRC